jgi:hypothetical protein
MKEKIKISSKDIKIRRYWNINPKTKIKESAKIYSRELTKKEIKEILKQEDF